MKYTGIKPNYTMRKLVPCLSVLFVSILAQFIVGCSASNGAVERVEEQVAITVTGSSSQGYTIVDNLENPCQQEGFVEVDEGSRMKICNESDSDMFMIFIDEKYNNRDLHGPFSNERRWPFPDVNINVIHVSEGGMCKSFVVTNETVDSGEYDYEIIMEKNNRSLAKHGPPEVTDADVCEDTLRPKIRVRN